MRTLLLAFALLAGSSAACAQEASSTPQPAIVSSKHPSDSLGEVVYTHRGKDDGETIVPGVLTNPKALRMVQPKFSRALKKMKFTGDVVVLGVVTARGDIIDMKVDSSPSDEASACALDAVKQYQLAPATLDNKPVATLIKVVVHFQIY